MDVEEAFTAISKLFVSEQLIFDGDKWCTSPRLCCPSSPSLLRHPPSFHSAMLLRMAVNRLGMQKRKLKELNENRKREVASLLQGDKVLQARVKVRPLPRRPSHG